MTGSGTTWINGQDIAVGLWASGTLSVTNGGAVSNSSYGYIGYSGGATGSVTVDGAGSIWSSRAGLYVGLYGGGTLSLSNGGRVSIAGPTYVAEESGSTGSILFGASGGTLTTGSLLASPSQLSGTGTVFASGLVSDVDLKFDSNHGLKQTLLLQNPGQSIAVNLDLATNPSANNALGAGWRGSGSLTIQDGVAVNSTVGYIGYGNGATGMATVTGPGSSWTINLYYGLNVGVRGSGTLSITNGGRVDVNVLGSGDIKYIDIGDSAGAAGMIAVDGASSVLTSNGDIYVGKNGSGTLSITNGASVSVAGQTRVGWQSGSAGAINFGANGGTLTTTFLYASPTELSGTGTINTNGLVSDVDLKFDSSHGLKQTIAMQRPGQSITVNLDLADAIPLVAGWKGAGSVTIGDGFTITSTLARIGYWSGATGVVSVTGSGSTWTTSSELDVGLSGSGVLSITNGGAVNSNFANVGGNSAGSRGAVTVDGVGSTWIIGSTLCFGNSSVWTSRGDLTITNGGAVTSGASFVGYNAIGVAAVKGVGSTWTDTDSLYVGGSDMTAGSGSLAITHGGSVSNTSAYIASRQSIGTVVVADPGSTWTCAGTLSVGDGSYNSFGTLAITGGGSVTAMRTSIGGTSLLTIDVGRGSLLTVGGGTGTVTNDSGGTIRFVAGAGVPADGRTYSPIVAKTFTGGGLSQGTYQAIGGTWSTAAHTFAASSVTTGVSGTPISLNLKTVQRALIDDSGPGGTNWEVGARFLAAGSTKNITFTGSAMDNTVLSGLRSQLPTRESILSGWTFSTTNYTVSSTNPIYLSFIVGAGHPADELDLWQFNGSTWTEYSPIDLTYDGTYASFTATGLSGYAMVAVPEPGTLALLATGALGLLACVRRIRKVP